jgi:hypothetical protein
MTQNPKNKNFSAPEINVRNQPAFVVADIENDAGANSVCLTEGLPQILKAQPIRPPGDSVPRV